MCLAPLVVRGSIRPVHQNSVLLSVQDIPNTTRTFDGASKQTSSKTGLHFVPFVHVRTALSTTHAHCITQHAHVLTHAERAHAHDQTQPQAPCHSPCTLPSRHTRAAYLACMHTRLRAHAPGIRLAKTMYIQCTYGISGLEITKYTVYIRHFWLGNYQIYGAYMCDEYGSGQPHM